MKYLSVTRLQLFIICAIILSAMCFMTGRIGMSFQQNGSNLFVYGSSSPMAVIGGLLLAVIAFCFRSKNNPVKYISKVPIWRRSLSFFIDFLISIAIVSPIMAIPILAIEAFYTGKYSWYFERAFTREHDSMIIIFGALIGMIWILFYYSFFSSKGRQSIGHYIMGYRILNNRGDAIGKAMLHTLYGFLCLSAWIITVPMAAYQSNKHFLHESNSGYFAELLIYK